MAVAYDFRVCKACEQPSGVPTYRLPRDLTVYVCGGCGFHYIDYLDDVDALAATPPDRDAESWARYYEYIETALQGSRERFESKVRLVSRFVDLDGARCLDIGAGGGLFLKLLRDRGARVWGVEPTHERRRFAAERYHLELSEHAFEGPDWWRGPRPFDLVTLWDVLEHVNFPMQTLDAAMDLPAPGGVLVLDTPARDGFYHRAGEWTYRLTGGRHSGFLRLLYSNQQFSHKQIFHSKELADWAERRGHDVVLHERVHELSRPYAHYLRQLLRSERLARRVAPIVGTVVDKTRFVNKTLMAVRKR